MASILVRDIEDSVKERLQSRAVRHGHSMEAEVRDILRDVVKNEAEPSDGLGSDIALLFTADGLRADEALPELRGHTLRGLFDA